MKPKGSYIPLAFGEKGINEIIGCSPKGKFVAIEVKKPRNKPSPGQLKFIQNVKRNKGIAFVAYSLDDVLGRIESIS
jgi:hypothetical protein